MKKSKLSVGLVTSFIGALALTACNATGAVTAKDGSIIEFVGYNSDTDTIEINTDLYNEIGHTEEGTKLYYDAILETLIRYEYPILSKRTGSTLKSITVLETKALEKVRAARQTAEDNAKTNQTTPEKEWNDILESHDCETEEDLKQYYLFQLEKEEMADWYYKNNSESLKDEYIGVSKSWQPVEQKTENVDPVYPYHILHVLVTLSADKADYIRGTITQDDATNLWNAVRQLIDGQYSFQEIAANKSNDGGSSGQKYGDVEIMSTKTSFYNEFKLGIYAYDALLSGVNEEKAKTSATYKALGLDANAKIVTETTVNGETRETVQSQILKQMVTNVRTPYKNGFTNIPTVPYDVFRKIGEVAEDEKIGLFVPEAGDVALPRNVLYNQFLNFHSPFIVTSDDIVEDTLNPGYYTTVPHNFTTGDFKLASTNFVDGATISTKLTGKQVLCDKDGNVIIGVRSEAGIHFMVMRKSVFEGTNIQVGRNTTSLQDYYTTYIPSDPEYAPLKDKQTFVNMKRTDDDTYYTERANTIKNEIKSKDTFDAAYDYRLYETLMEDESVKGKIKFHDYDETSHTSQIQNDIENYIKRLRETKHESDVESLNNAWETYLLMLRYQNEVRSYDNAMVPTTCAFTFNKDHQEDYKEGGRCYVNQK